MTWPSNRNATARPISVSVIIPARNEAKVIAATVAAVERARARFGAGKVEVIVVDNLSSDGTAGVALAAGDVYILGGTRLKAPCARNDGAAAARGDLLVFVDADTRIPEDGLLRASALAQHHDVGIFRIEGDGPGWRSRLWWGFWNLVRHLPLPHAKALPAFMFCTRDAFLRYGPFDERVVIGEEWPITAGCYRADRARFVYDSATAAVTSNRRMERQRFGYVRTLTKYVWAVLHYSGRIHYSDRIR
jgi:glycosyltransferase involved in cell wall biosynthesis